MSEGSRSYDKEFKLNAVALVKNSKKSQRQIAFDLGVPLTTLHQWIKNYEKDGVDSFRGKGVISASNEEMFKLKKELADVKLERDILKKAVAIFSKNKV